MKMKVRAALVCAIAGLELLIAAAAMAADTTAVQQVTAANDAFYQALSARDIKAMDAVWAKKAYAMHIAPPPSKTISIGHYAIMKSWEDAFDVISEISVTTSNVHVETDGDRASIVSSESAKVQPRSGGDPVKLRASVTHRFEKAGNVWLLVSRHVQAIAP